MGRVITPVAVIVSFVAFGFEVAGSGGWWVYPGDRASYVLVIFAVAAALMTERTPSTLARGAQVALGAVAVVFMVVAIARFYGTAIDPAYPWATEAQILALAALAVGLTLPRRRPLAAVVCLAVALAAVIGCAAYATSQKTTYAAELWWWIAIAAAWLVAAVAAGLERDDSRASVPSGAGGEPGSDPGVE